MAWKRIDYFAVLSLALIISACGGDSGSNASNDDANSSSSTTHSGSSTTTSSQDNLNYSGIIYKTYEGLVAEQPCELSLNLTVAHVSSTNVDYLCSEDASTGDWSWRPYQGGNGTVMGENGRIYETFVDSRDGHVYKMVTIGSQTWMAENLDFASDSSFCYINSKTGLDECGLNNRGRFYRYSDAIDSAGIYSNDAKGCGISRAIKYGEDCSPSYPMRGVCPQGWHLPDTMEWRTLFEYTGCRYPKCDLLIKDNDHLGASDAYGFSALRLYYLDYGSVSEGAARFWTSTIEWSLQTAQALHHVEIFDKSSDIESPGTLFSHSLKIPVRCIKNTGASQTKITSSSSGKVQSSSSANIPTSSTSTPLDGDYIVDDRDGQFYRIVTIGSQTWMAQNLNYDDGNGICYDNKDDNCVKYGRLYGANTTICPTGWHLPTIDEWNVLFKYVGGSSVVGQKLKSTTDWNDSGNGFDNYRFSALPAGNYETNGGAKFSGESLQTVFWGDISGKNGSIYAHKIYIRAGKDDVVTQDVWIGDLPSMNSIRCIKGETAGNVAAVSSSSAQNTAISSSSIANGSYACGDLWCGKNLDYNVNLGDGTYGSWFEDVDYEGSIIFPVTISASLEPVIEACKGICGQYEGVDVSSYAGVGFYVSGNGTTSKNITSWKGLCVSYKSNRPIQLRFSFGEDDWYLYYDATPEVTLPASTVITTKDLLWSQFAQPTWTDPDAEQITGTEAAKKAVSIKFWLTGSGNGDFAIYSVGKSGSCK